MSRPTSKTVRTVEAAVVLLFEAPPRLAERCRDAAARAGAILRACDRANVASLSNNWRPLAIILTETIYAVDGARIEIIARDVGALVIRLTGDDIGTEELEGRVVAAVSEAQRLRKG